jgi:hypothetical protein
MIVDPFAPVGIIYGITQGGSNGKEETQSIA